MATLAVNQTILALLRERCIFHSLNGANRWAPGSLIAVAEGCEIEPYAQIFQGQVIPQALGAFSYSNSPFSPMMRVGRYSSISWLVSVMGEDHPSQWASTSPIFYDQAPGGPTNIGYRTYRANVPMTVRRHLLGEQTVTIGHDVWIGEQVLIRPGVTIGHGAIVGARALVTRDVPPYAVVVGQPARVMKYRFPEDLVAKFLALEWWRFPPAALSALPMDRPAEFLDALAERFAAGAISPMQPVSVRFDDLVAAARAADPSPTPP